ncbi:flagellar biosynthesis anti-sigma factor FlgM [Novosphingobium sp.]|uniref:flagellar biosynthesis anti-sigma factor FlgM n=1 Tax=Novosphingobium sp. TaxID=1874826 RepID=UPI0026115F91|nr:flagellar biosynthesis anti-sigma factor FlgM [Novosphingobium sp.]
MSSLEIGAARPVSAVQVTSVGTGSKPVQTEATAETPKAPALAVATAAPQVETSEAVKAGAAPVDQERVQTIRHAIETGTYPVLPTKIADAMIAAGMLLRSPK